MSGQLTSATACSVAPAFVHDALFYSCEAEYAGGIARFIRTGIDAGEAALIAVPGERHDLLRRALGDAADRVPLVDMRAAGRNPARILPFIQSFLDSHPGVLVRFVGEPIWAGRSPAEVAEGHRHEALINEAFVSQPVHILCPYDLHALEPAVVEMARRTHPTIVEAAGRSTSPRYADPASVYAAADVPLPQPSDPTRIPLDRELATFRHRVFAYGRSCGLDDQQCAVLALAAHEAVANTVVHGSGHGTARVWHAGGTLVCEVADSGIIEDRLVGRRAPQPDQVGARGLWLINQLCDLVELRSGAEGTVVRMHMDLADDA